MMDRDGTAQDHTGDAPDAGVTRRVVLTGAGATTMAAVFADARPAKAIGSEQEMFFDISRAVTGRSDLNPQTAGRLLIAMKQMYAGYSDVLTALSQAVSGGGTPKDILARAEQANVAPAMHQLIAAWYMGSAKNVMHAPMVSYYDALMYRPTRDALPVPTYCFAEPGWWTQDPPQLGIPAVAPKAAPPSPPPPVAVETKPPPTTHVLPNKPVHHQEH
ncbi:sugar dehydrogenase complex small subunit [Tanticharoenia sakaeratensis]|nr:sugar dehydrogenase complex small subunit [Tanticharoenia sakaeratensis]GBQ18261.1 membrane bound FAD containing D-sorbitol dehydrogenase [Tanticharoenia sakaeratensis NBRC 103193]